MSRRIRNLAAVGIAVALTSFMVVSRLGPVTPGASGASHASSVTPTPEATPATASTDVRDDLSSYAVALPELRGLPSDAAPGTIVDLWVTWDAPVMKEPQVQPLLRKVTVQKIISNAAPEAPPTVLLGVEHDDVGDLLYGDRYGSLSAVLTGR